MSFGQTLRTAREAKGLTTSELASRTHLLVQIVEGLENEDFHRIPAPIYGRGFVKLYCETVDLDPKPLQAEFMEIFAARKDAPAKVARPAPAAAPTPEPAPAPAPAPVPEPEPTPTVVEAEPPPVAPLNPPPMPAPAVPEPEQPVQPELPPAPEPEQPAPEPAPRRSYGDLFEHAYAHEEPEKPSAAEKFRSTMSNVSHGVFSNVKRLPPNKIGRAHV